MATLEVRLNALATAVGVDIKNLRLKDGDLATLSTTAKNNLVAAINEIFTLAGSAAGGGGDVTTAAMNTAIAALKTELVGGAGAALDTFGELEAAMAASDSVAAAFATALTNRVRWDAAQALTDPQKQQALDNIGAIGLAILGNPDTDLVAIYVAAKA